ncbi:MAG: hypothetical protein DRJ47_06440 [Thermoprotei archaeon]|nr:MAG: hypothetical protein DRJ47_06440 [Thermoprotei archaeon]
MAVIGIITNAGLSAAQAAASNEGWYLRPVKFSVSDTAGDLDPTRTTPNTEWYEAEVSPPVVRGTSYIEFPCHIPPGVTAGSKSVAEIYLWVEDSNNPGAYILFGIGQPTNPVTYYPDGELVLRLAIILQNANLSQIFEFKYTQAHEIEEHNADELAHPPLREKLKQVGVFFEPAEFKYVGQFWDEKAKFHSSVITGDIVYKSPSDGKMYKALADGTEKEKALGVAYIQYETMENEILEEGNGVSTSFTVNFSSLPIKPGSIALEYVISGETYTAADDGNGNISGPLLSGSVDYDGGTANLTFSAAPDSGTSIKATYDYVGKGSRVIVSGLVEIAHSFSIGVDLFLSDSEPGKITDTITPIRIGRSVGTNLVLLALAGGGEGGLESLLNQTVNRVDNLEGTVYGVKSITTDYTASGEEGYILADASNNRVEGEEVGTGDGVTTTFTLSKSPIVENSETIYVDGVVAQEVTKGITDEVIATADGTTTSYHHVTLHRPLKPESVVIHYTIGGVSYTATDDGSGSISGSHISSGSVDYSSGTVDITFDTAPDADTNITIDYSYYPYIYTLNYDTGELTFNEAPDTGLSVTADYQRTRLDVTIVTSEKRVISVKKIDNSNYPVVIIPSSGLIDGQESLSIEVQYTAYKLVCDGTNWWLF